MTELGPNERRLLRALHAADEPSEADRARVRTRLMVKLGAAAGLASAVATAAKAAPGAVTGAGAASVAPGAATATTAGLFAGTWKIGSAIVVVAAAAGGAAWVATGPHASEPAAATAHQTEHAAHASAKPAVPETAQHESADKATAAARPARIRARSLDGERKSGDLEGELALLENAQQALKDGDSARALEELERHASEHPGGALATERAGIRAVALCEAGKLSEGRREARRFLSKNPKSPLAVRVKAACLGAKK